jgi:hypothetical protein
LLAEMLCDQKTRDTLGEEGLAAVAASLWAVDCQTCGRPLGTDPPALCIDDSVEYAIAAVHHPGCREPGWDDSSVIAIAGGANLSWTTRSLLLPGTTRGKAEPWPVVLLNPGLEMIFLEPQRDSWRPGYHRQFTSLGMVPPGRKLRLYRPLQGATAWLANDFISVTVGETETIYEATAPREVVARAKELRLVLFMVTHALDPAEMDARRVPDLLGSGQVIGGSITATWD